MGRVDGVPSRGEPALPPTPFGPAMLPDGSIVDIEQMGPSDAPRLERFHHTLSRETIRLRFFGVHPELSERELTRFTNVDHEDREALIAVHAGDIVAVARLDRLAEGGDTAEVAFVVTDAWQGRGLGSVLFDRLTSRARELGVRRFVAETLQGNQRMLGVFRESRLARTELSRDGVVHVILELEPL